MTEATWGDDAQNPSIDWRMSAALANVPRGDSDVPEVTNLAGTVREWLTLDPERQQAAVLTPEHPVTLDGVAHETLTGETIATLAERLPAG